MHSVRGYTRNILLVAGALVLAVALYAARQGDGVQVDQDVVYGEAGGQKLMLDVYRPTGPAKTRPAIVWVHGGGWSSGDKSDFKDMGRGFAKLGYVGFSVNYRLANAQGNKYPAQVDDVQRAMRWIRAHATQYGIDPNRVGAIGGSAGGHLVAILGTRDTRDNSIPELAKYSSRAQCVVDIFGPTDFTEPAIDSYGPTTKSILLNFFGAPRDKAAKAYRDASPIIYVNRKSAPFLIFHGTVDPLVPLDQSRRLDAALKRAGVESELVIFEGEGHGFQKKENMDVFIKKTVAFFNRHLKP